MRIRLIPLIIAASGKVFGEHSQTHLRTNANGTCYVCRNPHHRPPTPKQIEARQRMVRAHQQYELIKADPSLLKHFEEAFARQTRFHRLCDFIFHHLPTAAKLRRGPLARPMMANRPCRPQSSTPSAKDENRLAVS